ncbi:putative formate acetyltransferase 2 (pyruvate formate lyase II) [Petrocella atlantisensis]|uniref:Putative formate acetyltransferase 2 (Pyruvate formate lyase II) n=1 Tax=Petrocella atlantisensis TaxID=2173034 RepID=A0A3P7P402_9FIRM|nr:formate C-acetyltransferase/glycerol dehydratase family glycyl radical enzyme [Petrocella atlantisensis]VDN48290.1 putative formate acetyltransferase 2 (pyruvate formate lyase II) [Petrocella atlantisensis]
MRKNLKADILEISKLKSTDRIKRLKEKTLNEPRYLSLEQAKIITECYQQNAHLPRILQRAKSLESALENISIYIDADELIVGNRTPGIRSGVVSPEAGISWIDDELSTLDSRPQDKFFVRPEDVSVFREEILPFWKGKSLEDMIKHRIGNDISEIKKVAKINQTDHAQGHICPNTEDWLKLGPSGLKTIANTHLKNASTEHKAFYESVVITLSAAQIFMKRYGTLAEQMSKGTDDILVKDNLKEIGRICFKLAEDAPSTFREAIQSLWFLYVILQMESNASSFSPGRADQYLYPYLMHDLTNNIINMPEALEVLEALWLKFNQIVYLRNSNSAKYFAGFPIGFNIACGGQTQDGEDASNALSYLFLKAQEHILLPQPNLSARLFKGSAPEFVYECSRVIGMGSGMPQIFNDESIIPALMRQGIKQDDATNYAIVGCVELTTHGNNLGWSDAAMFNLVKALELTLNNGICLQTGKQLGIATGYLTDYKTYHDLEEAYKKQLDYFIDRMITTCDVVDRMHAEFLPSPFLSSVIDGCLEKGIDVTAGGALYNLSGIQAIQVANLADSLATIKHMIYDDKSLEASELLQALQTNYEGNDILRQYIINRIPKYGNDVSWVDHIGNQWVEYFSNKLSTYENARGGPYHTGLYTVSAHIPMGQNVGASADGRLSKDPLADGGMSAMYGRDKQGPTALLKSVSRINSIYGSNGTLLNMKFLPDFFKTDEGIKKFSSMLMTIVHLNISHVQFNVLRKEDLLSAQKNPDAFKGLTVRVAGYTAYFVDLATDLQDEIIARTSYGDVS